jgi:hypothetical protein
MLLQQLRLEPRHEPLGQLADVAAAARQSLPFVRVEERELRRDIGRRIAAREVQVRHRRRPWIDVGRQQAGAAHEPVDERALARLDLPDHGDAARELGKQAQHVVDEGAAAERPRGLQLAAACHQLAAHGVELRADLACSKEPRPGVCARFRSRMSAAKVVCWIRHGLPLQVSPPPPFGIEAAAVGADGTQPNDSAS